MVLRGAPAVPVVGTCWNTSFEAGEGGGTNWKFTYPVLTPETKSTSTLLPLTTTGTEPWPLNPAPLAVTWYCLFVIGKDQPPPAFVVVENKPAVIVTPERPSFRS